LGFEVIAMAKLRLVHAKSRQPDEWETEFDVVVDTPAKQVALRRLLQRRWLKDRDVDEFNVEGDDVSLVAQVRQWIDEFRREVGRDASLP